jgi:trans-aconitate methyltransferase
MACGPGSITVRLLRRFPEAEATLIDVDPALLAIAEGVLGADARVRIVRADLADPGWAKALPAGAYDAVLTANSLHR